ncbi:MAG: hypothetical protein E6767_07130 [Dysgonomonas sp.]|nr:hypothetical protein [Dysgonomonas sp.]
MKRLLTLAILAIFAMGIQAQQTESETKVLKRTVEKNYKRNTKSGYNYFLLDAIRDVDAIYKEYEDMIQAVWAGKEKKNLKGSSKKTREEIDELYSLVKRIKVYIGGLDYQQAVLAYIESVKEKAIQLETYGILSENIEADVKAFNEASEKFNNAVNDSMGKRDHVREMKNIYERTTYMKVKK